MSLLDNIDGYTENAEAVRRLMDVAQAAIILRPPNAMVRLSLNKKRREGRKEFLFPRVGIERRRDEIVSETVDRNWAYLTFSSQLSDVFYRVRSEHAES